MAVGDKAVLRVVGRFQAQNIINTLHYEMTAQASADLIIWEVMAANWLSLISTGWLARHADTYTLIGLKMFSVDGDAKPPGFIPDGTAGSVAADPQEAYVCRTLTLYSENLNPRVRGRVMLSGGTETMFNDTDGSVAAAELTALDTLAALLLGGVANAGDEMKLILWNTTLGTANDVVSVQPRVTPSLIRSRRVKQFLIG